MRPILLQGHERSLTMIKYNREGDLLFSSAKDKSPTVWRTNNGERLGTFEGHNGAVWCIDVNYDTSLVMTGSADSSARLWEAKTGKELHCFQCETAVRSLAFGASGISVAFTTDATLGRKSRLFIWDLDKTTKLPVGDEPRLNIEVPHSKITCLVWGPLDKTVFTGHENGNLIQWDAKTGERLETSEEHDRQINSVNTYPDGSMFVTSSRDFTAKLWDAYTFKCVHTYKTEKPVNSSAISPIKDHVVLGGGQDAKDVTTTAAQMGQFEARFFHLVFEEEICRLKGHFGPINTVAFHPSGRSFASGGEDGFIRLQTFDPEYYSVEFEY
eukprot:Clim_evm10s250 gene=Clim_evmTU10s250